MATNADPMSGVADEPAFGVSAACVFFVTVSMKPRAAVQSPATNAASVLFSPPAGVALAPAVPGVFPVFAAGVAVALPPPPHATAKGTSKEAAKISQPARFQRGVDISVCLLTRPLTLAPAGPI